MISSTSPKANDLHPKVKVYDKTGKRWGVLNLDHTSITSTRDLFEFLFNEYTELDTFWFSHKGKFFMYNEIDLHEMIGDRAEFHIHTNPPLEKLINNYPNQLLFPTVNDEKNEFCNCRLRRHKKRMKFFKWFAPR